MTEDGGEEAKLLELMADQHYGLVCLVAAIDELHAADETSDRDRLGEVPEEQQARLRAAKQRHGKLSKAYAAVLAESEPGTEDVVDLHRSIAVLSRCLGLAEGASKQAIDSVTDMTNELQHLLGQHREHWRPVSKLPI